MRHRKSGRKFGRQTSQRHALRRHVTCALFEHGRITTTVARAKDFRPFAEKMITIAKRGAAARAAGDDITALNAYRRLLKDLHDETTVARLIEEIGPANANRPGGYTRMFRNAHGRLGDNAPTVIFELVERETIAVADDTEATDSTETASA